MAIAHLPDAQLYYQWDGPEDAAVLLFSNSLGTTCEMWSPQMDPLAKHYRVLRYDTRGHGRSSVTPGPYSIEQLGRDVVALLDSLRIDRVNFCGLSMGGMIGMWLGSHAPERLRKLVLCNTAAKIGTLETWNTRIETVRTGGMNAVAGAVIERWLTPAYRSSHPAETAAALSMLESTSPAGYVANCAAVRDFDQRQSLSSISVPALVIAGSHDPVTPPSDGRFLAANIPGAMYVEVSAAHLSNIEAAGPFNSELLAFLRA